MNTKANIAIQHASQVSSIPSDELIAYWANLAVEKAPIIRKDYTSDNATLNASDSLNTPFQHRQPLHITLRVVDSKEITELNTCYRNKPKATNVLSFPFEAPMGIPTEMLDEIILGDIAICAPIVDTEATQQGKSNPAHWAHMVIHGTLHLLGYDHIDPKEADIMEGIEIQLLKQAGFSNPYHPLQPPSCNSVKDLK